MVYEMRCYSSKKMWNEEDDSFVIVWETSDKKPVINPKICGKLLAYLGEVGKTVEIPDGIDTIGAGAFYKSDWDYFDCPIETLVIPASVTKIEEGAFEFTNISKITISPDSPAGIVRNKGLYTKDESTLLWVLEPTNDGEYTVPDGVTRIGRCAVDAIRGFTTVIIPSSVEKIYYNENEDYHYDGLTIKAPAGSYAIKFAKKHGIDYEEL